MQSLFTSSQQAAHHGVLAAAASGLSQFITHQGGDIDRVFGLSGIDPELLGNPTMSLSLVNYCRVMEVAAKHSGVDNFGLYYGKQFKPQSLGLIGYIGICSATLEQALRNVVRAFPYHQHDTLIQLVDKGDSWQLHYQVRHGAILQRRQDAELTLCMFLNLIRHALGSHWAPREIHFEHPRPAAWHEHCKAFDAPIWFDQPTNCMVIPKSDGLRSMPDSDPMLLTVTQDAIRQLNGHVSTQPLIDQIRVQVQLAIGQGEPELEQIAEQVAMTPWSLQRRLRQEGISFTGLVDKVRGEMAMSFLQQPHISVTDMALLLGYSEVSAFSRAFKRWFGTSPRQWRQSQTERRFADTSIIL
ncbi:AraC family transcriptional regulator [Rosenbergiella epipactidis]|uniref:AraC-like transcriptional regulator QhpR n=1 Tax=Rosenbergiella epipactidis TaxID=1544694 RepID=UPI001BDAA39E|nr:AraC family transcriptional regulator [Rosenbergiella epipactidis]MBT0717353.1 AraC family transcriptional regulator [Rosenbergiella epipactidis]